MKKAKRWEWKEQEGGDCIKGMLGHEIAVGLWAEAITEWHNYLVDDYNALVEENERLRKELIEAQESTGNCWIEPGPTSRRDKK